MKKFASFLIGCAVVLAPQIISACAVCFGGTDDNLRDGFFWGIALLGALPFLLIGFFIYTIRSTIKKKQEEANAQGASHG